MELCVDLGNLVRVDEGVRVLGIHIAYTASWMVSKAVLASYPYEDELVKLIDYVRSRYTLDGLRSERVIRAYRDFFWRLNIDPTKTRPSSEALVRRVLRGQFPRVNPVVDAGNIASVYTLVSIGMYDLDKVVPPLAIKYSAGGEVFKPIGGDEEVLGSGVPVLVDARGTVMHIYPHRDSIETCVSENTSKILTIAAGVPGISRDELVKAVKLVVELLKKLNWNSCEEVVHGWAPTLI